MHIFLSIYTQGANTPAHVYIVLGSVEYTRSIFMLIINYKDGTTVQRLYIYIQKEHKTSPVRCERAWHWYKTWSISENIVWFGPDGVVAHKVSKGRGGLLSRREGGRELHTRVRVSVRRRETLLTHLEIIYISTGNEEQEQCLYGFILYIFIPTGRDSDASIRLMFPRWSCREDEYVRAGERRIVLMGRVQNMFCCFFPLYRYDRGISYVNTHHHHNTPARSFFS